VRSAPKAHLLDWRQFSKWMLLPLILGCAMTVALGATVSPGGPAWESLTPVQQRALAPLAKEWPQLPPNRKAKWLEVAARYPSLPTERQQLLQQRMTEWARLSPEQRGQARTNFQEARRLSHEERREQWEAYKALPKESKDALAARATRPRLPQASVNGAQATQLLQGAPLNAQAPKSNIVNPANRSAAAPKAVAPAMVQAGPGAATSLVATPARPPSHLQTGKPKIDAGPSMVNRSTLLPKNPDMGAAGPAVSAASAPMVHR
jgi:hypothetical protein